MPSRGVTINEFLVLKIIRLTYKKVTSSYKKAILLASARKIYMVTKMLFEIAILCFIFVLLESSGGDRATSEAFIFSLNNSEGLAPFWGKVTPGNAGKAIETALYYGPKFGADLVIHVEAVRKHLSEVSLGHHYSFPASVTDKGSTILTGKDVSFSPDEVEVFYLDPSP